MAALEEPNQELARQNAIFHSAIALGSDFLEATDALPTLADLARLREEGYFDHDPSEIEDIFYGLEDYHEFVRQELDRRTVMRQAKKTEFLELIAAERRSGTVPENLFRLFQRDDEATRRAQASFKKVSMRLELVEGPITDDEAIRRYFLYKIVEELTPGLEAEADVKKELIPAERRVNITLGFNVRSFVRTSSMASELNKANSSLSIQEAKDKIELIASRRGWLDFVDSSIRGDYLRDLKDIADSERMARNHNSRSLGAIALAD